MGRGGDQAVVKHKEKIAYYGGKSKQVEKSTRVKARVKAHALRELIQGKEKVFVMGHKLGDTDSFGAAIGIYRATKLLDKRAYIVINDITTSVRVLIEGFMNNPDYEEDMFLTSEEALDMVGLTERANNFPAQLSGGMRQRAALIRTLALDPALLILDEPFSALDYQTRLEVADDITTLIRKSGKTVLMVTHDLSEAVSIADRILVLSGRPCTVKAEIPVVFPDHITSPGMRRQHPYFSDLFKHVWKELKRNDGAN